MKKILLTILFCFVCSLAHATTWYACSGGGNWNGASVWTSILADEIGCTGATGNPVAGDTATLNSNSGNITITAAAAAAVIDMTGYTGTLALGSQTLTISGGVTLGGTITATTGTLSLTGSQTLTSNGITWPGRLTFTSGTPTITLVGNWINSLIVTISSATVINKTTTETITALGNWQDSANVSGTAKVVAGGTGTFSGGGIAIMSNDLDITAGSGTVTFSVFTYNTGTVTWNSGTIAGNFEPIGSCTINTNGGTWATIQPVTNAATITLTSDLNATTLYLQNTNQTYTFAGAFNITLANLQMRAQGGNGSFKFAAGQTLNITNSIQAQAAGALGGSLNLSIASATPSSKTFINYTGTKNNAVISGVAFTDVQTTGSNLFDYGLASDGLITRSVGINLVGPQNIGNAIIE